MGSLENAANNALNQYLADMDEDEAFAEAACQWWLALGRQAKWDVMDAYWDEAKTSATFTHFLCAVYEAERPWEAA